MGDPERQTAWTAWAYGHPRKQIIDLLERRVTNSRTQVNVPVGITIKSFQTKQLRKAVYGTGWDSTVVFEAKTDGTWQVIERSAPPNRINVNSASADDLTNLPTIGPARARAIVSFRTQNGRFNSIDQLLEVPGIGPATLTAIRDLVFLGN